MAEHILSSTLIEGYDPKKAQELDHVKTDWQQVYSARQNDTMLQAEIVGIEQKQYSSDPKDKKACGIVWLGSVKGLLPIDLAGVEAARDFERLIGKTIAFKVESLDRENETFIANRLSAMETRAKRTLTKIAKDMTIPAIVTQVFNSVINVDIGGIECRIPVSEISDGWIESLHDEYKEGDHIHVKVMEIDKENKKVNVSIKALLPDYWATVERDYEVHNSYIAHVTGTSEFGIFVEFKPGVTGLSPLLRHENVKRGQKVLVRILRINKKEKKITVRISRIFD